jgi:hypothetical protein
VDLRGVARLGVFLVGLQFALSASLQGASMLASIGELGHEHGEAFPYLGSSVVVISVLAPFFFAGVAPGCALIFFRRTIADSVLGRCQPKTEEEPGSQLLVVGILLFALFMCLRGIESAVGGIALYAVLSTEHRAAYAGDAAVAQSFVGFVILLTGTLLFRLGPRLARKV